MKVESVAEQLLFTTVRVDTVTANGGTGAGTAFLFAYKRGDEVLPFVVTNKHVVHSMRTGSLTFTIREGDSPKLGHGFHLGIDDWPNAWFGHPSPDIDIAVCAFAPMVEHIKATKGVDLFYRWIESQFIPTQEQLEALDAIEVVTFVGYPNGIWDRANLLPVARRGTTATPPYVDFENSPRFLIDASVFGGSSGSPVFLLDQGAYSDKQGNTIVGSRRLYFLGVIAAVYFRTQLNQIVSVPIPTVAQPMAQQEEMLDLGIVFKARTVVETIEAFLSQRGAA